MVRPRLYCWGDIHNRELRYGRITPFGDFTCFTTNFHREPCVGKCGALISWELFPEKISRKFFGTGPPWGRKHLSQEQALIPSP